MLLALHPMGFIFLNSSNLLEHLAMLLALTLTSLIKSKLYHWYYDLISKFNVALKSFFLQGLSEPEFYGDLVYYLNNIIGSNSSLHICYMYFTS